MVKGGTKRKPEMKKITNKASRATTFSKRRDGLYSKAAQLCVLSDAQIAILATPSSSNSNASFFSFGHFSVESVVSAYLSGQRLTPVSSSRFWWEDDKLVNSKNPKELMEAMESMEVLMSHLKRLEDQTLTTTVDEDKVEISPDLDEWSDMDLNQLLEDCDDVPVPPPVVCNTDKEEGQNVSEKTCNNNSNSVSSSLPAAAEKSLEEATMDLDFDSIFEGLISYDDEDLFWSDELLSM
ncbi:BnaC06g02000D [Brassica napus]|uniref:BnaC06g02000D protein n=1 Tax=Brassica napus TaxID=3708 RepID=A0A078II69_BRANA|nr:BnaC06g02000D [Brassica napus]